MTTVEEWEELNSSQEEIQSIHVQVLLQSMMAENTVLLIQEAETE